MSLHHIGKYEIIATLGRGSMGVVYKAKDPEIGRTVAIKTLRSVLFSDDEIGDKAMQRFRREAALAGALQHPNIVTIFESGKTDSGYPYIVMEIVHGKSLDIYIRKYKKLSVPSALHYLAQAASAVDYAHSHGILHRDLKPTNLIVDKKHKLYLLDFGVAEINDNSLTPADTVVGTPSYMSPEQIRGEDLDSKTDIFSFAIVAYEMLTGHKPFPGKDFSSIISTILNKEPLTFSEISSPLPLDLEKELLRALSKEPKKRPNSALEFVDSLASSVGVFLDAKGIVGGFKFGMTIDDVVKTGEKSKKLISKDSTQLKQVSTNEDTVDIEERREEANKGKEDKSEEKTGKGVVKREEVKKSEREEVKNIKDLSNVEDELTQMEGMLDEDDTMFSNELILLENAKGSHSKNKVLTLSFLLIGAFLLFGYGLISYGDVKGYKSINSQKRLNVVDKNNMNLPFTISNLNKLETKRIIKGIKKHKNKELLNAALEELKKRGDDSFFKGLKVAASDKRASIKVLALKKIRENDLFSEKAGFEIITLCLYDKDFVVRGWAAKIISSYKSEDSKKALLERLRVEQNDIVKKVILRSLKKIR